MAGLGLSIPTGGAQNTNESERDMRALTQAQLTRRLAILDRLEGTLGASGDEIRSYLIRRKSIIVTVDTVQSDLRAMEKAGKVSRWRCGRYWLWTKDSLLEGIEEARRQSRPDDVT